MNQVVTAFDVVVEYLFYHCSYLNVDIIVLKVKVKLPFCMPPNCMGDETWLHPFLISALDGG